MVGSLVEFINPDTKDTETGEVKNFFPYNATFLIIANDYRYYVDVNKVVRVKNVMS